MRRIVIVGGSLAGVTAAQTLRAEGFSGSLTIVGDEPPYDRPPLSKEVLLGSMSPDEAILSAADALEADWRTGSPATRLEPVQRTVVLADGSVIAYDGLVIATGSAPRRLPGLEPDGARILDLRTMSDALRLRQLLSESAHLVIVGCGFIGVEIASAARAQGIATTVISLESPLAQAGTLVSAAAETMLREHGVELLLGRTVQSVATEGRRQRVVLDDGRALHPDGVVVAVGAVPRTGWLRDSGLRVADGVECDAALRVLDAEGVVAAGDVARWPNALFPGGTMRIEHWNNARDQGVAAARALMADGRAEPFLSVPSFWSDHFGHRLRSVGLPGQADAFEVTDGAVESLRFAAAGYREGRLVGGVTYGMPRALAPIRSELGQDGERAVGPRLRA